MTRPTYKNDDWEIVVDFEPPEAVTDAELDLLAEHLSDIVDAMVREG